jgi:hypothetical protein
VVEWVHRRVCSLGLVPVSAANDWLTKHRCQHFGPEKRRGARCQTHCRIAFCPTQFMRFSCTNNLLGRSAENEPRAPARYCAGLLGQKGPHLGVGDRGQDGTFIPIRWRGASLAFQSSSVLT